MPKPVYSCLSFLCPEFSSVCPQGCGRLIDLKLPHKVANLNAALVAGWPVAEPLAGQPGLWVLPGGDVYRRVRAYTKKVEGVPRYGMPTKLAAITDGRLSELEFDEELTAKYRGKR